MSDKTSVIRGPKQYFIKTRAWARSMTSGTAVATLPKGARLLGFVLGGVASDAGTTATLSVGTSTTANELVNAASVLTTAGAGPTNLAMVSGKYGTVLTADTTIYLKYAETGTASTVGGGYVTIQYSAGNITNDDTI